MSLDTSKPVKKVTYNGVEFDLYQKTKVITTLLEDGSTKLSITTGE
jgi:hypothetical protein